MESDEGGSEGGAEASLLTTEDDEAESEAAKRRVRTSALGLSRPEDAEGRGCLPETLGMK